MFGHISLILGKDKSKMSKRHGSVSVVNYQNEGFLPEALVNFLALLGWSPEGEEEIFSMAQLEEQFSLDRVSKSPAVFDIDKLKWLNGQYLRKLPDCQVAAGIQPYLEPGMDAALIAATFKNHLNTFAEIKEFFPLFQGTEVPALTAEASEVMAADSVGQVLRLFREKVLALETFDAAGIKGS